MALSELPLDIFKQVVPHLSKRDLYALIQQDNDFIASPYCVSTRKMRTSQGRLAQNPFVIGQFI